VAGGLLAQLRRHGPPDAAPIVKPELTQRELDVLSLIVWGCENGEMDRFVRPGVVARERGVSLVSAASRPSCGGSGASPSAPRALAAPKDAPWYRPSCGCGAVRWRPRSEARLIADR
jgi:hypothetical protein